jgi:Ras-related protein Rab-11A
MSLDEYDYLFKIVTIGDSGAGKSCLLSRFAINEFDETSKTTIGVEFRSKSIDIGGKRVKCQIWDTAGQERYRAITNAYYRGAMGVMLVFDITRTETFRNLEQWIREIRDNADHNLKITLVGNKCDLKHLRMISTSDAKAFAESHNMEYIETSAKDATNVLRAFTDMAASIKSVIEHRHGDHGKSSSQAPSPQVRITDTSLIRVGTHTSTKNKVKCC